MINKNSAIWLVMQMSPVKTTQGHDMLFVGGAGGGEGE